MRDHLIVLFILGWMGMAFYVALEMAIAPEIEDECSCPGLGQKNADEQCVECGAYAEIGESQ